MSNSHAHPVFSPLLDALSGSIGMKTADKCCARGSFDSYVQDEIEKREEAVIKAYCEKDGYDFATLSDFDKGELLEWAQADREQERDDNGQFGSGA